MLTSRCEACDQDSFYGKYVTFPEELDFETDQEYIIEFLNGFVNSIDTECEFCGEIAPENIIRYESCEYEYSIFIDNKSSKRFKSLKASISETKFDSTD